MSSVLGLDAGPDRVGSGVLRLKSVVAFVTKWLLLEALALRRFFCPDRG
jgi:hypothetical protein